MAFAKLYETEQYGQILVMKDHSADDGPEIAFHFESKVEGVGVCAVRIGFPDNDRGHDVCDNLFEKIDQKHAEGAVYEATREIADILPTV